MPIPSPTVRRLTLAVCTALAVLATGCAERGASTPGKDRSAVVQDKEKKETARKPDRGDLAADARLAQPEPDRQRAQEVRSNVAATPVVTDSAPVAEPMAVAPPAPATGGKRVEAIGYAAPKIAGVVAPRPVEPEYSQPSDTSKYASHADNPVVRSAENPVSTFSIDVDTGSYANVRKMLRSGRLPPADAVRAEEFINYFDYAYAPPKDLATPFSVTTEVASAPWNAEHKLMLIGIKGYDVAKENIPASNLVFLIDTSGSMNEPTKLPLLRDAFKQMVPQLRAQDRVSIVVYAGSAGLVLPPTPGDQHERIVAALDRLAAGGSTNGGAGIQLAYDIAQQAYIKGGVNRVILATDGDFNVGTTNTETLKTLIADKRSSGVALTTLGFGDDNYNDELAEQLADVGNGNHFYIDAPNEARKVLVEELSATTLTIAKDVKIQVEFNPAAVAEYRLIGYENRALRREDFNNDKIDAGEIGAGHNVTALYELTMAGTKTASDPLRYAAPGQPTATLSADEIAFVKLRYKRPAEDTSRLIERPVVRREIAESASPRLRYAAAVAAFADSLRGASHLEHYGLDAIAQLARDARGADPDGYRAEFLTLVQQAASLRTPAPKTEVAIGR